MRGDLFRYLSCFSCTHSALAAPNKVGKRKKRCSYVLLVSFSVVMTVSFLKACLTFGPHTGRSDGTRRCRSWNESTTIILPGRWFCGDPWIFKKERPFSLPKSLSQLFVFCLSCHTIFMLNYTVLSRLHPQLCEYSAKFLYVQDWGNGFNSKFPQGSIVCNPSRIINTLCSLQE
mgnify:CR=1 FL=1